MKKRFSQLMITAIALTVAFGNLPSQAAPAKAPTKKVLSPQERAKKVGKVTILSKQLKSGNGPQVLNLKVDEPQDIEIGAELVELITIATNGEATFQKVVPAGTTNANQTYKVTQNQSSGNGSSIQYQALGLDSMDAAYRISNFAQKFTPKTTVAFKKPGRSVITVQATGISGNTVTETLIVNVYEKASSTLEAKKTSLKKGGCTDLTWSSNAESLYIEGKLVKQAGVGDPYSAKKTGVEHFCRSKLPYTVTFMGENPVSSTN